MFYECTAWHHWLSDDCHKDHTDETTRSMPGYHCNDDGYIAMPGRRLLGHGTFGLAGLQSNKDHMHQWAVSGPDWNTGTSSLAVEHKQHVR